MKFEDPAVFFRQAFDGIVQQVESFLFDDTVQKFGTVILLREVIGLRLVFPQNINRCMMDAGIQKSFEREDRFEASPLFIGLVNRILYTILSQKSISGPRCREA